MESQWNKFLLLKRSSGYRILPKLSNVGDYMPAPKLQSSYIKINSFYMESLKLKNQSDNKYMISKTLPSAVHTGSSKGVNVRLQRTKEKESSEFERDSIETNEFQREREREKWSWYPQQQKGRRLKGVRDSLDLAPPQSLAHSVFVMNIRSLLCCFFPIETIW